MLAGTRQSLSFLVEERHMDRPRWRSRLQSAFIASHALQQRFEIKGRAITQIPSMGGEK
jgi:hypothetical protein